MRPPPGAPLPSWLRLDNAAKIYPAARTRNWMALYRLSLTLREDVDPELLQQALNRALLRMPLFAYRLRRGLFWYYLDRQERTPRVESDAQGLLLPLTLTGSRGALFRLRCHRRRIALEIFHALADGGGACVFLLTLTAEYLFLRHGTRIPPAPNVLDVLQEPREEEWEDSFAVYAREASRPRGEEAAWRMSGTPEPDGRLRVVCGTVPTARLLNVARERKTTVNSLLGALMLQALIARKAESRRHPGRPVKLSLPVNLRKIYPSRTLRNFSSYVNVPVRTDYGRWSLDDLISLVAHTMGLETLEPMVNARFSANVKAERNPLLRAAPLFVKTLVLKLMFHATGERYMTSTLSNLGRMELPPEMERHVERMDVVVGRSRSTPLTCGVISACGRTSISFTKTIQESGVERDFFTSLVKLGIPVLVQSN